MAAGLPLSAKFAKIRYGLGPTTLWAASWEVRPTVDKLDTTTFEDGGWGNNLGGIKDLTGTIEMYFDDGQNQFDNAIQIGNTLVNLKLYINDLGGGVAPWLITKALILATPMTSRVRELVMMSFEFVNQGAVVTFPTGNN